MKRRELQLIGVNFTMHHCISLGVEKPISTAALHLRMRTKNCPCDFTFMQLSHFGLSLSKTFVYLLRTYNDRGIVIGHISGGLESLTTDDWFVKESPLKSLKFTKIYI